MVKHCRTVKKICLITNFDDKQDPRKNLDEIRDSLAERDVVLEVINNPSLHDREIRFNSGWVVKIGRGLDIYQKSKSKFSIGFCDLELRPTLGNELISN